MWKQLSVFTSYLLISLAGLASNADLEIQLITKNKKALEPGSTTNIVLMLINNSDSPKEFHLKINTPPGWSQLTDYTSVMVEESGKALKILSFHAMESTKVGDYTIGIDAFEREQNRLIGSVEVPVRIKPRYQIQVKKTKSPEYVFSGDSLEVEFMIENLSNVEANIQTSIINNSNPELTTYTIPPDSHVLVRVPACSNKDILYNTRKSISLTASIIEKPDESSTVSCIYDIIPSSKVKFDAWNRFPVKISGMFVSGNKDNQRTYGAMFDIRGSGMISQKRERSLDFHFRGPDRKGDPSLGLSDEYYLSYSSPRLNMVVGDHNYRFTDLTESSRGGRGARLEYQINRFKFGSFVNFPRFYPELKQVASIYSSYSSGEKFSLMAGLLNKTYRNNQNAQLVSLTTGFSPWPWGSIELETAGGTQNGAFSKALKTGLKLKYSKMRTFVNYTMADPEFPGYFSNTRFMATGFSVRIKRKVNLSFNYNFNHSNIAADTLFSNAPFSKNMSLSAMYRINPNHNIGVGAYERAREDRMEEKLFNYKEYIVRLSMQNRIKKFSSNMYGEMGKTENFLLSYEEGLRNVFKAHWSLSVQLNDYLSLDAFANYHSNKQYSQAQQNALYYGGSIHSSWKNKLDITLEYQNNYELEEYYRDRSLFTLNVNFSPNPKHELGLTTNYNLLKNSVSNKQFHAGLRYTYTINVPVSKKDNIGSLKGRIINKGVDNIQGIIFSLAGNITVSDEHGNFEFPVVKTGSYLLIVDDSKTGLNAIAETPGPYKIEIVAGQQNHFELALTKSSSIQGAIIIEKDANSGKKGFIPVKEQLENLIIEAKNTNEVFRVFSNKEGTFRFDDLRPGSWLVKVYKSGIPKGYQLQNDQFQIELAPGQNKQCKVKIKKISRKIRFQSGFHKPKNN